jgi:hypothetical protein
MGVVLGVYKDRIGWFPAWRPKARETEWTEGRCVCSFLGVILIVLLMIRGTELNAGFQSEQDKLETIIAT